MGHINIPPSTGTVSYLLLTLFSSRGISCLYLIWKSAKGIWIQNHGNIGLEKSVFLIPLCPGRLRLHHPWRICLAISQEWSFLCTWCYHILLKNMDKFVTEEPQIGTEVHTGHPHLTSVWHKGLWRCILGNQFWSRLALRFSRACPII